MNKTDNIDEKFAGGNSRPAICSTARYKVIHFDKLPIGTRFTWLGEHFTKISETEARFEKVNKIWNTFKGIEVKIPA